MSEAVEELVGLWGHLRNHVSGRVAGVRQVWPYLAKVLDDLVDEQEPWGWPAENHEGDW